MCSHPQIFIEFLLKTSTSATVPITGDIVVKKIYQWNSCSNENIYIVRERQRKRKTRAKKLCVLTLKVSVEVQFPSLWSNLLSVYLRIKGTHIFKIHSYKNKHVNRITCVYICWILDTAHL